jgi:UDP-N-acetylglucosamine transferase subunit ALG13
MIVFTIGTSEPFDRLVCVADAVADACGDEVLVQGGRSQCRLQSAELVDFLTYDELVTAISRARAVVTHAGAGSVLLVIRQGKRPIVVPRLRRHGEAVDDHQLVFARRLHDLGLVHLLEDPAELPSVLRSSSSAAFQRPRSGDAPLSRALRAHLAECLGR